MTLFPQWSRRRSLLRAGKGPSLSNYRSVGKALSTMGPSGIRWSNQGRLGYTVIPSSLHGPSYFISTMGLAGCVGLDDGVSLGRHLRLERYDKNTRPVIAYRQRGVSGTGQNAPGSIRVA